MMAGGDSGFRLTKQLREPIVLLVDGMEIELVVPSMVDLTRYADSFLPMRHTVIRGRELKQR